MEKISFTDFIDGIFNIGENKHFDTLSDAVDYMYYKMRSDGTNKYKLVDYNNAKFSNGTTVTDTKNDIFRFNVECIEQAKKDNKNVSLFKNSNSQPNGSINGWFYRIYKNSASGWDIVERLSLNVYMDQNLIKKLDEIVEKDKGEHITEYKVPSDIFLWAMRHDPVTIYFSKLTPSLLQEIVDKVKPYLRPEYSSIIIEDKNPYNINLPKGIYYNKEPQPEQVKSQLDKIKNFLPDMENELRLALQIRSNNIASVAMYKILSGFVNRFEKYADKIDAQSIYDYYKKRKEDFLKSNPDYTIASEKLNKLTTVYDIIKALDRIKDLREE
ncbi:MAG: hypothetical protein ACI4N3_05415 [Alphaproteobacteria bacterium]